MVRAMVAIPPMMPASLPASIELLPSEGPTLRSSTIVSLAGNAPDLSWMASCVAVSGVKLPLIWPRPPRIGSRITGAEITLSSSTMANGLPTLSWVNLPNLRAPALLKPKSMIGSLVRELKAGLAVVSSSPRTTGVSRST